MIKTNIRMINILHIPTDLDALFFIKNIEGEKSPSIILITI